MISISLQVNQQMIHTLSSRQLCRYRKCSYGREPQIKMMPNWTANELKAFIQLVSMIEIIIRDFPVVSGI